MLPEELPRALGSAEEQVDRNALGELAVAESTRNPVDRHEQQSDTASYKDAVIIEEEGGRIVASRLRLLSFQVIL